MRFRTIYYRQILSVRFHRTAPVENHLFHDMPSCFGRPRQFIRYEHVQVQNVASYSPPEYAALRSVAVFPPGRRRLTDSLVSRER